MGYRNPLAVFSLKGKTENITKLADIISDSYCITSQKNGEKIYRQRFAKAKKTREDVVEAVLHLEKHGMLDFGRYPYICMDVIRTYIMRSSSYDSENDLAKYFWIIEDVGELLDSGDSITKWFSPRTKAYKKFVSLGLGSQHTLLGSMLRSKARGDTVNLTILGMFRALKLTDPELKKLRDEFVAEERSETLSEKLLFELIRAVEFEWNPSVSYK